MINIDRDSSTPIFQQLVVQLRYLIATGRFQGRKILPSTRKLAASLGLSFHTVRKAYRHLETEGVLEAVAGTGYRVRDPSPLGTSERIEQGAAVVEDTLQRLAGLGLSSTDIEYLFDEQLTRMNVRLPAPKVVFASPSHEIAAHCAADVSDYSQCLIEATPLDRLTRHRDADYVLAEFRHVARAREAIANAEVVGVATQISNPALDQLSRLLPSETVGLLTHEAPTVRYIMERVKFETGFAGQILATPSTESREELVAFAERVDLLVYTPAVARRVGRLGSSVPMVQLSIRVSDQSKQDLLQIIPSQ